MNKSKDPSGTNALARMAHYRLTLSRVDSIAPAALRADPGGPSANETRRLIDEVHHAVAVDPPLRLRAGPVADRRRQRSSEAHLANAP